MSIIRNFNVVEAHRRHLAGESINKLAKDMKVSRKCLSDRFLANDLPWRNCSDAAKLVWTSRGEREREKQTKSAHDAARGKKKPLEGLYRRAQGVQNACRQTMSEIAFCKILSSFNIFYIPQMAFGEFNVDIAIPSLHVAIEINGSSHYHPRVQASDKRKFRFLSDIGWHPIIINFWDNRFRLKDLISSFEVLGLDPAFANNIDRVIPRQNKLPSSSPDLKNFSLEPIAMSQKNPTGIPG